MKRLLLIILLTVIASSIMAENTINDTYEFPVQRGSEEWQKLSRERRIYQAYQIPDGILTEMSTSAIIKTFINCPFADDCLGYEDTEECFKNVSSKLNMYEEMINRIDYIENLLEHYLKLCESEKPPIDSLNSSGVSLSYSLSVKIFAIEMLLTQTAIAGNISDNERKELYEIIYRRLQTPMSESNGYSVIKTGLYILAHNLLLNNSDYKIEYNQYKYHRSIWYKTTYGKSIIGKYVNDIVKGE